VGLIGGALIWADGLETPEAKAFVDAYARKYRQMPSWFAEANYSTGIWIKAATEAIKGRIEDRPAFLDAVRKTRIKAPRGPLALDKYDNPNQNVYVQKVVKVKHPILGEVKVSVPVKTYENVSQFWTWKPEEVLSRGPYTRQ
jgi:branched-chain amino acid transport system substrate-binding protein